MWYQYFVNFHYSISVFANSCGIAVLGTPKYPPLWKSMKTNELGQYPHREGLPYKKDVLLITEETQPLFYPLKGMTSTLSILFGSPLLGQSTSSQLDPAWPHADCIFTLSGIYNTVYIHQCWYEISDIILKNKFGRLHYYLLNPKNIIGKLKIKLRQFDHKNT